LSYRAFSTAVSPEVVSFAPVLSSESSGCDIIKNDKDGAARWMPAAVAHSRDALGESVGRAHCAINAPDLEVMLTLELPNSSAHSLRWNDANGPALAV